MLHKRLAIVDLETTGAHFERDRITEIAIINVEEGVCVGQWNTLINPGVSIPSRITAFTGIDDAMVATAPSFKDVADEVFARLHECVFVAHNARFDYGFLSAAFAELERPFLLPIVCTVRFSRALFPQYARHGLDAIIQRQAYEIDARHRALDDAQIVWQFLQDCARDFDATQLEEAGKKAGMKLPARQPRKVKTLRHPRMS